MECIDETGGVADDTRNKLQEGGQHAWVPVYEVPVDEPEPEPEIDLADWFAQQLGTSAHYEIRWTERDMVDQNLSTQCATNLFCSRELTTRVGQ